MKCSKAAKLLLSLAPSLCLLFFCPLGMTQQQSGVTAGLLLVLIWWATGLVERTVAACALLGFFLLLSGAPLKTIFTFPRSENFVMIAVSFLFSQGIVNSHLAEGLLEPLLRRFARTPIRLLLSMLICSGAVMCFIPQSISRVILVATIFSHYFDQLEVEQRLKSVLMFGLFFSSIFMGLLFIRGDLVLNYGLITVSGIPMTELTWARYITVPTLLFLLLSVLLYILVFRRELAAYAPPPMERTPHTPLSGRDRGRLAVFLAVAVLWATEPLHHLSGTLVVCAGTVLMFPMGLLHLADVRAVNLRLLVFLTAAFSIGGVMKFCGVADLVFDLLTAFFPPHFSPLYALAVMLVTMALHMVLGSNVTTLSVVVPGLLAVSAGIADPILVSFLSYIAVSAHFLLPYHHVTLLVGEGEGYFSATQVLRYGIPLTALALLTGLALYLGWWKLTGLI